MKSRVFFNENYQQIYSNYQKQNQQALSKIQQWFIENIQDSFINIKDKTKETIKALNSDYNEYAKEKFWKQYSLKSFGMRFKNEIINQGVGFKTKQNGITYFNFLKPLIRND